MVITQTKIKELIALFLLCLTSIFLLAWQLPVQGTILTAMGLITLLFCTKQFRNHVSLLFLSLLILGYFPVVTILKYDNLFVHIVTLFFTVTSALFLPYLISRYIYKDYIIRFPVFPIKKWSKKRYGYLLFTAVASFILLSSYFAITKAYVNWPEPTDFVSTTALFTATMFLGVWDELFFVCTVLGIVKRYIPFAYANIVQAIIFGSFLYQIGFKGWGFALTLLFAFMQGAVYHKTNSLFYVITIHLTIDLVLFFILVYFNSNLL